MRMEDKTVLVTGGHGFLGRHLCRILRQEWHATVISPSHDDFDLTDLSQTWELLAGDCVFDTVFHCAGYNGGIFFNLRHGWDIFQINTRMALNLIQVCASLPSIGKKAPRVVGVVASCAYGDTAEGILREGEFFRGLPHESVLGHGLAKRNLQLACRLAHEQQGLQAVCVCPPTLVGPGDSFDLERTKVAAALVRRFVDAQQGNLPGVTLPGTGLALREFLHVEDAARLLILAALCYDNPYFPLNLPGEEISIRDLAELIADLVGYEGEIGWDTSRPDGQRRKRMDASEALRRGVSLNHPTPLVESLRQTIAWYRNHGG